MPLTNSQYDAIMREYAAKRIRHRNELEQRSDLIHREIPELAFLEEQMVSLAAAQARAAVQGDLALKETKKEEWSALARKKEQLLAEHGFSPKDLEMTYDCPSCRDTGYRDGHRCHCLKQALIRVLYDQSHIQDVLARENFHTFSYAYYEEKDRPSVQRAVLDVRQFIDSFGQDFRNLLFLGEVGTGKTFLCNCIAKELLDRCYSVVYLSAFELFEQLAQALFRHGGSADTYRQSCSHIFDCDLLIIDDLGTELNNSFISSQLFLCINERILKRRPTVISSNLNLKVMQDMYSERTVSRIMSCYTIWNLPGSDIRLRKKLTGVI